MCIPNDAPETTRVQRLAAGAVRTVSALASGKVARRVPPGTRIAQYGRMSRPWPGPISMQRRARFVAACVALVLCASGCKGDGGGPVGPDPDITGRWTGTAKAYTVHFSADFTRAGDAVGGSGSFSSPIASGDFVVSGTVSGRDVDLVLTSEELGATVFRGRFTASDRIEGTFDPNGSYELDLTLDRD